jgi:hypothetical protein
MSLALFKHFPDIERVKAGLAFVVCNDFIKAKYNKKDEKVYWLRWKQETDQLEKAFENDLWNPKPNFTCRKFCSVLECEHNGKGNYR